MRTIPSHRSSVALLVVFTAGCGTRLVPTPSTDRVPLETVITDSVGPNRSPDYAFVPAVSASYGVFVQGLEGAAILFVRDSASALLLDQVPISVSADSIGKRSTNPITLAGGRTTLLAVRALPFSDASARARFRFMVHRINPAPEHVSDPRFTIGDSVDAESIDDVLDIDDFVTTGAAGQEIIGVLEATGTSGPAGITLNIYDPAESFQTSATAAAGQPGALTDRWTLQTSGTYRARVQAVYVSNRYVGPYRFWIRPIQRAPEHRAAAVDVGVPINEEGLDPAGDVDEFTFAASPNTNYRVFLQSRRAALVRLQALDGAGNVLGTVDAIPADSGLFNHSTASFHSFVSGPITLRVFGAYDRWTTDTGMYRLYVEPTQLNGSLARQ